MYLGLILSNQAKIKISRCNFTSTERSSKCFTPNESTVAMSLTSWRLIWCLSLKPEGIFSASLTGLAVITVCLPVMLQWEWRRMKYKQEFRLWERKKKSKEASDSSWSACIFPHSLGSAQVISLNSFSYGFLIKMHLGF